MIRYVVIACMCALSVYSRKKALKNLGHEAACTNLQRAAAFTRVMTRYQTPPTAILDAHYAEERNAVRGIGLSHSRAFYLVEVAPHDLPQWTRLLTPLAAAADYEAPTAPCDWWVARSSFASLQFYKPDRLTGKAHGWIGASRETGRIYIFT